MKTLLKTVAMHTADQRKIALHLETARLARPVEDLLDAVMGPDAADAVK
jgi:hypothetical protein